MSKPAFSKKRGGRSVPTYPLGSKAKTGGSKTTKRAARGRPRSPSLVRAADPDRPERWGWYGPFDSKQQAEEKEREIKAAGLQARIEPTESSLGTRYNVRTSLSVPIEPNSPHRPLKSYKSYPKAKRGREVEGYIVERSQYEGEAPIYEVYYTKDRKRVTKAEAIEATKLMGDLLRKSKRPVQLRIVASGTRDWWAQAIVGERE